MDAYAAQLDADVLRALDSVAPSRTRTKRGSSSTTAAWVTQDVKDSKYLARGLERRYHATKAEVDYVNWRRAGRVAARVILMLLEHSIIEMQYSLLALSQEGYGTQSRRCCILLLLLRVVILLLLVNVLELFSHFS